MPINAEYRGPAELPEVIPVFPLPGALLLPRGQMPLNIFEPRYLAMVDDALRDGHRLIGMIQPDDSHSPDAERPVLFHVGCVGRITQLAESGDGRYILELTGVARFRVVEEPRVLTPYRQCRVDFFPFVDDFTARKGEEDVDRAALLSALTAFLKANNLKADWDGIEKAPNEALVNALAMMSPYGVAEKQAMLEAPDLKTRAEILVAVTEMDLAKKRTSGDPPLQCIHVSLQARPFSSPRLPAPTPRRAGSSRSAGRASPRRWRWSRTDSSPPSSPRSSAAPSAIRNTVSRSAGHRPRSTPRCCNARPAAPAIATAVASR